MLANYGSEGNDVREQLRKMVETVRNRMWPGHILTGAVLDPNGSRTEAVFVSLQNLAPKSDLQTTLKSHAMSTAFDLGQMRWQEFEQAKSTVSIPLLCILTFWLATLFVSFGMFAPSNSTVIIALVMAAIAVSGGIFLMMELNSPFSGVLQIASSPFDDAIAHLGK
jgi:hypothetical protein